MGVISKMLKFFRSSWQHVSMQYETRFFLVIWLALSTIVVVVSFATGFYADKNTLSNILGNAHISLLDLFIVAIVASFLLAKRSQREWKPTRDMLLSRLFTETDRLLQVVLPRSIHSSGDNIFFSFGEFESTTSEHFLTLQESDVDIQIGSEALDDMKGERYLAEGSSEAHANEVRIARFLRLQQSILDSRVRILPLFDSARSLVRYSVSSDLVSAVARVYYALLDLEDTLNRSQRSGFKEKWVWIGNAQATLALSTLQLFKRLAMESSSRQSFKERFKNIAEN